MLLFCFGRMLRQRLKIEMTILFLCTEDDLSYRPLSYAQAFRRRGIPVVCVEKGFPVNGDLQDCLRLCPERPSLIIHPEAASPYLPSGLTEVDIPTACFQVDTYAYTRRRIAWSMLFDHVFVSHPGYDAEFRTAGHPAAHFIPHAVDAELFAGQELERTFEVGWVGQV